MSEEKASSTNPKDPLLPHPKLVPKLKAEDGSSLPVYELLRVDPENMDDEYRIQASWFATVAWQCSTVELELDKQERFIKELEADVFTKLRGDTEGGKKPPEAALKAAIATHTKVKEAWQKYFQIREVLNAWDAVRQGLLQKKEMLINMGASLRLDKKSSFSGS